MRVAARTDRGRIRKINEDAFYVGGRLLAVADGLGGYSAGEVASRLAVAEFDGNRDWSDPTSALQDIFSAANRAILERAAADPECAGMGTTLTACYIGISALYAAHVGDSRLYLFSGEKFLQLTGDHSIVGELMRVGGLTEEEARVHPQRNILTRALGADSRVEPDLFHYRLGAGDRIMLCTDGLYSMVSTEEIATICRSNRNPEKAAARLIQTANAKGGPDNITVIVVDIDEEDLT